MKQKTVTSKKCFYCLRRLTPKPARNSIHEEVELVDFVSTVLFLDLPFLVCSSELLLKDKKIA